MDFEHIHLNHTNNLFGKIEEHLMQSDVNRFFRLTRK